MSTRYADLTREQLEERLAAAEEVCLMFGWSALHEDTDRDIAAYLLWSKWLDLAGDFADPRKHPHLSDEAIAPMVAAYSKKRGGFRRMARSIVVQP